MRWYRASPSDRPFSRSAQALGRRQAQGASRERAQREVDRQARFHRLAPGNESVHLVFREHAVDGTPPTPALLAARAGRSPSTLAALDRRHIPRRRRPAPVRPASESRFIRLRQLARPIPRRPIRQFVLLALCFLRQPALPPRRYVQTPIVAILYHRSSLLASNGRRLFDIRKVGFRGAVCGIKECYAVKVANPLIFHPSIRGGQYYEAAA